MKIEYIAGVFDLSGAVWVDQEKQLPQLDSADVSAALETLFGDQVPEYQVVTCRQHPEDLEKIQVVVWVQAVQDLSSHNLQKITKETALKELSSEHSWAWEALSKYQSIRVSAQESQAVAQRALADYQNLVRRTQQERSSIARLAAMGFVEALLPSLEHLEIANASLKDKGISMILSQLWLALEGQDLKKIECLGQPFSPDTMEAVGTEGSGEVVVKVVRPGFTLSGQVIQPAKVMLGDSVDSSK